MIYERRFGNFSFSWQSFLIKALQGVRPRSIVSR